ncbi:hypothetical protein D9758_015886 [Tetrapyrgos nigripes]|uniref:HAT C-terminal dimerisation domain-containing protein n=1 Tax=Tetrapyrgos nigripes TaxID=182062 RepID=A0A8H5CM89_9AGAR|nr:hypothetical protein D9758_015886 [Tetrapyrgos nigripes]
MVEHDRPDPTLVLPDGSRCQHKRKQRIDGSEDATSSTHQPRGMQKARKTNKKSTPRHTLSEEGAEPTQATTSEPDPTPTLPDPTLATNPTYTPTPNPTPTPTLVNPGPTVIEIDDENETTDLKHRLSMPGRPKSSCVADHPQFQKKESLVYTFLIMVEPEHKEGRLVSCEMACAFCSAKKLPEKKWKWNISGRGSTSNFLNHFKAKHTNVWTARNTEDMSARFPNHSTAPAEGSTQQLTLHSWTNKAFDFPMADWLLAEWMVLSCEEFLEVDNQAFRRSITHLRPAYSARMVKADAAKNHIHEEYEKVEKRLKEYLKNAPGKKVFAADAWTSNNNLAYLVIVVSFITEEWEMASLLFDFPHLKGQHTGKNMAELLAKKIIDYGLADDFSALAADNASNNDTLCQELASILNEASQRTWYDPEEMTVHCLPHAIHLAVQAFLIELKAVGEDDIDPNQVETPGSAGLGKNPEETAEEVTVQDEGMAEMSDEELLAAQVRDGIDVEVVVQKIHQISKLTRSSPQRWNSTYFMVKRAKELRAAIDELCTRNDLYKKYKISSEEWEVVDVIVEFLEIFRTCSEKMSASNFPTLSASLLVYVKLMNAVDKFMESDIAKKNAILDPCLKHKLFEANPNLFTRDWRHQMETAFKERLTLYSAAAPASTANPSTTPQTPFVSNTNSRSSSINDLFNDESLLGSSAGATETAEEEYARYLGDRTTNNVDCLAFWKMIGKFYPRLAAYARDVLAIPGFLVAVERVLSVGRDLIGLHRHSLSAETSNSTTMITLRKDCLIQRSSVGLPDTIERCGLGFVNHPSEQMASKSDPIRSDRSPNPIPFVICCLIFPAISPALENAASNAVAGEHVTTKNTESTHASKRKPTGDANGNQQHKKKQRSKKTGNESAAEDTAKNTAPELMVDLAMSSSESEVDNKAKLSVTRDIDHFF